MNSAQAVDLKNLVDAADILENELRRHHHSHPLIFKAKRVLELRLDTYMRVLQAKDAVGFSKYESRQESLDLVRECWVMLECATHILHGP